MRIFCNRNGLRENRCSGLSRRVIYSQAGTDDMVKKDKARIELMIRLRNFINLPPEVYLFE